MSARRDTVVGMALHDVLAVPVLRAAAPVVVAGGRGLGRRVRWVHTSELADVAPLLRSGDLLLSTGIALPDPAAELVAFAESLDRTDVAGLVVELGRRWTVLPEALVTACEALGLPLVALQREVPFAAVAQAVGERIVDTQLEQLRHAQHVHDVFAELNPGETDPGEVLEVVAQLTGCVVALEDEQHRLVDYRPRLGEPGTGLADWRRRSRAVTSELRTTWDEANGWLVTRVGPTARPGGRLVVQSPTPPTPGLVAAAERGAAAVAVHQVQHAQRDTVVRRAHAELLTALAELGASPDVVRRCELAGLPAGRRSLVGVTVRLAEVDPSAPPAAGGLAALVSAVAHAVDEDRLPALVAAVEGDVRVLVSLDRGADPVQELDRLGERVRRRPGVVVAAGSVVDGYGSAGRSLRESVQVADAVRAVPGGPVVHRLPDAHLRGLLAMLADDDRLRTFVDRELEALRDHDARWQAGLVDAVRALVLHPGSKSLAATSLHISRQAFYDRLGKVQRLLGVDLDDPDVRVSLHTALLADDLLSCRSPDPGGPGS